MSVKEIELFKIRDAYKMVSKNNMLRECVFEHRTLDEQVAAMLRRMNFGPTSWTP